MSKKFVLNWVDCALCQYMKSTPKGIILVILLGMYCCYIIILVINSIKDVEMEVDENPGGCTRVCQPADVRINKPLKAKICKKWMDWMINFGSEDRTTMHPTQEDVVE